MEKACYTVAENVCVCNFKGIILFAALLCDTVVGFMTCMCKVFL